MSVSAGTGGTTLVGVVVGGGAVTEGTSPGSVVSTLPFTGASHLTTMVVLAMVLLITGALALGLARRVPDGDQT